MAEHWGEDASLARFCPSRADDEAFKQWWGRVERISVSPGALVNHFRSVLDSDIRHVLPSIRVPTLVLQRINDLVVSVDDARYIAAHIPGASLVELPGEDHVPFVGDQDSILDEIEEFVTDVRHHAEPDRVLATVMFTDIVGSTEKAAELGDRRWADTLNRFYAIMREQSLADTASTYRDRPSAVCWSLSDAR